MIQTISKQYFFKIIQITIFLKYKIKKKIKMEMFIKETGKTTKPTATDSTITLMEPGMRESGSKINSTVNSQPTY